MTARHIILPAGRASAVIVLTVAEVCALHTLAAAALDDSGRAIHAGASKHSSGQPGIDAAIRAVAVLAGARADLPGAKA